jgi:hypothetical protein
VTHHTPHTAGLSGDHGWNDAEDRRLGGVSTAVLVMTTGIYWAAVWLLAGLPPLALLVSRKWRNEQA